MSSFTHALEEKILNAEVKGKSLYLGLSRCDGNRKGTFAVWGDNDGKKEIDEKGIDEPGRGWIQHEGEWVTETSQQKAKSYARKSVGQGDWHDVDVVNGAEGESELRLKNTIEFGTLQEGEDWGTINTFFIADSGASGGGNILAFGKMPESTRLTEDMTVKLWGNTIVIRMTK